MKHLFIKLLTIPEKNPEHDYYDVSLEWVIKNTENELIGQGNADHRALMDLTGLNGNWDKDFEISVILLNTWAIQLTFQIWVHCAVYPCINTSSRTSLVDVWIFICVLEFKELKWI